MVVSALFSSASGTAASCVGSGSAESSESLTPMQTVKRHHDADCHHVGSGAIAVVMEMNAPMDIATQHFAFGELLASHWDECSNDSTTG